MVLWTWEYDALRISLINLLSTQSCFQWVYMNGSTWAHWLARLDIHTLYREGEKLAHLLAQLVFDILATFYLILLVHLNINLRVLASLAFHLSKSAFVTTDTWSINTIPTFPLLFVRWCFILIYVNAISSLYSRDLIA